jgi:hypothetical protein
MTKRIEDIFGNLDCLSNGEPPKGIDTVATTFETPGEFQVPIVFESELRAMWRLLGLSEEAIEKQLREIYAAEDKLARRR